MKLVVNAVMGSMMAAFAEGMSLADRVSDSLHRMHVIRRNRKNTGLATSHTGNHFVELLVWFWVYGSGWCFTAGTVPA
jgi:3-hydroxyisobutyrate dehydrogenase-like beta-hydroxyacid dehydrogenase